MTASKIQIANFSKDFSNIYWHYDIIEHLANDCEDATLTTTALKTIYG